MKDAMQVPWCRVPVCAQRGDAGFVLDASPSV